jgi:5'-nucleotidase / UDP-sugar diphosphatase
MKIRLLSLVGLIAVQIFIPAIASAADTFTDVPASHPNYEAIMDLKSRKIIEGYADGTFKPEQKINRVEALKIILLGSKTEIDQNDTSSKFPDTQASVWYSAILNTAVKLGIVEGYPDGTFKPAQTINLVEALKITQLSFNIDLSNIVVLTDPYADTPKESWYAKYVQFAKDNSLIDADSQNKVYPDQAMSRAKLSELIYRLIKKIEEKTPAEIPTKMPETTDITLKVDIQKYIFAPKDMQIGLGSTVKWTNSSSLDHTITSSTGLFDSGTLSQNGTFSFKFNQIGTYTYYCKFFPTMTGTITVKPANQIPTI